MEYTVIIAEQAERALLAISSAADFKRLEQSKDLFKTSPDIGRAYDPAYEAAQPPFACRQFSVPGTPYTYYYVIDHPEQTVFILEIADQRRDPARRFRGWE